MKIAFDRIFRKNRLFMVLILLLFVVIKAQGIGIAMGSRSQVALIDELIIQSAGMSDDELEAWLLTLTDGWGSYDENELKKAKSILMSSISDRNDMNSLISFARTGEGKLPITLPKNYAELMGFYGELQEAQIINYLYLDDYFQLQAENLVPVFVLCLVVVCWSYHYESEMYRYTKTVKNGEQYTKSYRRILLGVSFFLMIANELLDLTVSGLLSQQSIWNASMQSYRVFAHSQMDCNMLEVFVLMWISKVFGVCLLTMLGEWIASTRKNLKDAAMASFFVLMAFLFLDKALSPTPFDAMMQMGYVDWRDIICASEFFPRLGKSSMEAGVAVTVLLVAVGKRRYGTES